MATELYTKNIIPETTLEDLFYNDQQNINNVNVGGTYVGSTMVGGYYKSAETGARVEILPDPYIGIVCYSSAGSEVFKTIVHGTDIGDVIMGDYSSGKYVIWDDSAATMKLGPSAYVDTRLASTLAGAINASGNLINDIINAKLDTSAKQILDGFKLTSSGALNISGTQTALTVAASIGDTSITVSSTTGFPTSGVLYLQGNTNWMKITYTGTTATTFTGIPASGTGSITEAADSGKQVLGGPGVIITPKGLITINSSGAETITLEGATGNATFAGTLSAASGTLGTITSCNITGGAIDIASGGTHYFQVSNAGVLFLRTESTAGSVTITNTLNVNSQPGSYINLGIATTDITLLTVARQTTGVTSNNLFTLTDIGTTSNSSRTLSITSASTGSGLYLNKTGAGVGLYIKQDGSANAAIDIEQNGTTTFGLRITQNAAADAARFISASGSGAANVVSIFQSSQTQGTCLFLSGLSGYASHIHMNPIVAAPTGSEGDLYADTDHKLYYHNGTAWKEIAFV
jgi:hypothetical protein